MPLGLEERRVKTMEDYVRIRRMHEIKGLSLREISRQTGFHRDTIKKIRRFRVLGQPYRDGIEQYPIVGREICLGININPLLGEPRTRCTLIQDGQGVRAVSGWKWRGELIACPGDSATTRHRGSRTNLAREARLWSRAKVNWESSAEECRTWAGPQTPGR